MTCRFDERRGSTFCLVDTPAREKVRQLHEKAHGSVPHKIMEIDPEAVEAVFGRIEDPRPANPYRKGNAAIGCLSPPKAGKMHC